VEGSGGPRTDGGEGKWQAGMNHEDSHGVGLSRGMSVAHMAKKDVL
jgi:hypothetical protein